MVQEIKSSLTDIAEMQLVSDLRTIVKESEDEVVMKNVNNIEDDLLLKIIRCRKYKLNSAYERLRRLAYAREKYPDVFESLYPSRLEHAKENGGAIVLKSRDSQGRHVILVRAKFWDPSKLSFEDMVSAIIILGLEMMQAKETQLNGIVVIIDAEGFSLKQARYATPGNIQKYAQCLMNASPLKIKGVHLVNAPMVFSYTLSVVKVFLTQKLRNRIYAHGSMKSLHKSLSTEILPKFLGGKLSEEEAVDKNIIENLFTEERDLYYKKISNPQLYL